MRARVGDATVNTVVLRTGGGTRQSSKVKDDDDGCKKVEYPSRENSCLTIAHTRRGCGKGCFGGRLKAVPVLFSVYRCVALLLVLTAVQLLSLQVVSHFQERSRQGSSPSTSKTKRTSDGNAPTHIAKQDHFDGTTAIALEDLPDIPLQLSTATKTTMTWDEAMVDRGPILQVLQRFGLNVTLPVMQLLPTWSQVTHLYGNQPVIWDASNNNNNKSTCATFRDRVDARHRFVGVAGQMNTGTNALSKYLTRNIYMATNSSTGSSTTDHVDTKSRGVLWTVPWYKHGWASLRSRFRYHATPINHTNVMAVVVIRDPYFWMQSMCASPYTLIWKKDKKHCPQLIESTSLSSHAHNSKKASASAAVSIRWSHNVTRTWPSLAHVWSSWYREYYDNDDNESPRIFVRFEDLLFHTESVVNSIRECVGASWIDEHQFQYIAGPAKTHPYFARFKPPTSLLSAMIKYGQDDTGSLRRGQMTEESLQLAKSVLDAELMEKFHYQKLPKRSGL